MHHHGHHGHGRRHTGRRPFPKREELLERLTSYQRDLEQELVDIEDLIRHLRDDTAAEPQAEPTQA